MSLGTPPPQPPQPIPAAPPAQPEKWDPLPPWERRVLGVLVEKQKTSKTADTYPLTLNALTTGCNQKSNREPVMDLTDDDVEETLTAVQRRGLVMRMTGGRVDRFRHLLYEQWKVTKFELAVLAELLLRGPQTKGELRGRASRMDPIDTLDALDEVLKPLFARKLVVWLTEPDRRGATLSHGFHTADELTKLKVYAASAVAAAATESEPAPMRAPVITAAVSPGLEARLNEAVAEIERLKAVVASLARDVDELKARPGSAAGEQGA